MIWFIKNNHCFPFFFQDEGANMIILAEQENIETDGAAFYLLGTVNQALQIRGLQFGSQVKKLQKR